MESDGLCWIPLLYWKNTVNEKLRVPDRSINIYQNENEWIEICNKVEKSRVQRILFLNPITCLFSILEIFLLSLLSVINYSSSLDLCVWCEITLNLKMLTLHISLLICLIVVCFHLFIQQECIEYLLWNRHSFGHWGYRGDQKRTTLTKETEIVSKCQTHHYDQSNKLQFAYNTHSR